MSATRNAGSSPANVGRSVNAGPSYVPPLASFYGQASPANAATSFPSFYPQHAGLVSAYSAPIIQQQLQQVKTTRPKYNWESQYVTVKKRVQTPRVVTDKVTVMVPKEITETQMVPKETLEAVQVTRTVLVPKTVTETQTIMVPKVIETEREIRIPYKIMEQRKVVVPRQRVVMYEEEQVIEVPATEEYTEQVVVNKQYAATSQQYSSQQFTLTPYQSQQFTSVRQAAVPLQVQGQALPSVPIQYVGGQFAGSQYAVGQVPVMQYGGAHPGDNGSHTFQA